MTGKSSFKKARSKVPISWPHRKKGEKTNDFITFRVGKEIAITPSLIITFD